MKSNNWSKLAYIIGIIWSIGFAVRYLFIWQDYSEAIVFVGLGLILISVSWLYDRHVKLKNQLDYIEEQLHAKWENA